MRQSAVLCVCCLIKLESRCRMRRAYNRELREGKSKLKWGLLWVLVGLQYGVETSVLFHRFATGQAGSQ